MSTRLCGRRSVRNCSSDRRRAYRFVHDRVQEAAYSLMPDEQRAAAHLRIGRLLAAHTPPEKREEAIFEIVSHLNRGAALIASRDEREQLAELNLIAGKRAKASTAYASALAYFTAGAAFLPEDAWNRRHELAFALEVVGAECEFLTGALREAEQRLANLSRAPQILLELADCRVLAGGSVHDSRSGQTAQSSVCLDYLRHLGIAWSAHPTEEEVRQRIRADLVAAREPLDRGTHRFAVDDRPGSGSPLSMSSPKP